MRRETGKLTRNRILGALREREDVLRRYRVKRIGLFGSYAKGRPRTGSDIDLLVEFEQPTYDNYLNLAEYLEKLFGKKVDILTPAGVRSIRVKEVAERIARSVVYV